MFGFFTIDHMFLVFSLLVVDTQIGGMYVHMYVSMYECMYFMYVCVYVCSWLVFFKICVISNSLLLLKLSLTID
jgi:hypothetical protein